MVKGVNSDINQKVPQTTESEVKSTGNDDKFTTVL